MIFTQHYLDCLSQASYLRRAPRNNVRRKTATPAAPPPATSAPLSKPFIAPLPLSEVRVTSSHIPIPLVLYAKP